MQSPVNLADPCISTEEVERELEATTQFENEALADPFTARALAADVFRASAHTSTLDVSATALPPTRTLSLA
jgi:hypothetical protein